MRFVHEFVRDHARAYPDRAAIYSGTRVLSFSVLDGASDAVASHLQAGGLRRGDRVALCVGNSPEFVIALFGIFKAGGVAVPISPLTKAPKLGTLMRDCEVQAVISSGAAAAVVAGVVADVPSVKQGMWADPPSDAASAWPLLAQVASTAAVPRESGLIDHDLAAIIYTSGTTAVPKGVMLTHRNLTNTSWAIASYLGNTSDDLVMCVLPLSHTYGLFQVLVAARVGHGVALEASFAYAWDVMQRMAQLRVTGFAGVPAIFATMLELEGLDRLELRSLRYLTNAAGPLPPARARRLREVFPGARLFPMYGLTECTRVCYLDPDLVDSRLGSVGRAIPNCETWIVDGDGRRVGPGVVGELVVRGANVMRGYWQRPEETARAFLDAGFAGDRVLRTGDLFRTDEEGLLYFVGRVDDVFKCKGEKVCPVEVENVLCEVAGVVEAAVVGLPADGEGLTVTAVLVVRSDASPDVQVLRRHCRASLESHAVPTRFLFRDNLPKTDSGKLDRRALVRELGTRSSNDRSTP